MKLRFDTAKLIDRRVRVGHSALSLANHLGLSAATVRSIEGGVDPSAHTVGTLSRYAEALGIDLADLFATDTPSDDPDVDVDEDAVTAVATLVGHGDRTHVDTLADALAWDLDRLWVALTAAEATLRDVGLRFAWFGDSAVAVVPSVDVAPVLPEVTERDINTYGLNIDEAAAVRQLATSGTRQRGSNPVTTSRLLDAGIIEHPPSKPSKQTRPRNGVRAALRLTAETRYNLCLD